MYQKDKLADLISRKVEPKPYTLESLIAWLETKSATAEYDFCLADQCLTARAFGLTGLYSREIDQKTFPGAFSIARAHPWTFGAALLRARAYRDSVSA